MSAPRFFVDAPLEGRSEFVLPAGAARHVQVLRLQPGSALVLFDGSGREWSAQVTAMGRSEVAVRLGEVAEPLRELSRAVTLAVVMPANDRMDGLVEKATELGAAMIQPLMSDRSVLRLTGERADKKRQHWQGVAIAAAEQSGRTRPTRIAPVQTLVAWLDGLPAWTPEACGLPTRLLLSPAGTLPYRAPVGDVLVLSGPEGGLSEAEEWAARQRGFEAVSMGPRILRADTAPLAILATLALA